MTNAMPYAPGLFAVAALLLWEAAVRLTGVPSYLVPGPLAIVGAFLAGLEAARAAGRETDDDGDRPFRVVGGVGNSRRA